jgi:prepilin-type N-terminal cleavage/methylation domain-containing protein
MTRRAAEPRGVTLVELIVVLAIVAVMAGVTTLAFRRADLTPQGEPWVRTIAAARRLAIDSARTVSLTVRVADGLYTATALPDGSIVADPQLGIDRLTGEVAHAPQ